MSELSDQEKRVALAVSLAEYNRWMDIAVKKGWKLPGNSGLPNSSWVHYWKSMDLQERGLIEGRPVVPHR